MINLAKFEENERRKIDGRAKIIEVDDAIFGECLSGQDTYSARRQNRSDRERLDGKVALLRTEFQRGRRA